MIKEYFFKFDSGSLETSLNISKISHNQINSNNEYLFYLSLDKNLIFTKFFEGYELHKNKISSNEEIYFITPFNKVKLNSTKLLNSFEKWYKKEIEFLNKF